ncbi:hypothetical protein MHBO_003914 [Bonamia ostreae]|uniref:Uncharacterized protein n=1 Tax=Bonamia ostreae TaxID=126728 RepID=A0ABV2ARV2_9EUKA
MLLRHIEKYGEQPQYSKAEFCDWLKDGGIKKEIYKTKVLANTNGSYTIISENNTIYEIESCNNVIKIINNGNYEKWETPMCYNSYIGIL